MSGRLPWSRALGPAWALHRETRVEATMATHRYQVLVAERDSCFLAWVRDLKCEAIGTSVDDAIASVREKALRMLQEYECRTVEPPRPSRLTLALIELPAPARSRPRHLRPARRGTPPTLARRT